MNVRNSVSVNGHTNRAVLTASKRVSEKEIYSIRDFGVNGGSKEKKLATQRLIPLTKVRSNKARAARSAIIEINEELIGNVIKKRLKHNQYFFDNHTDETYEVGRIAIDKAIDSYDSNKGEFSTHACWEIYGALTRLLRKETLYAKHYHQPPLSNNGHTDREEKFEDLIPSPPESSAVYDDYEELRLLLKGGIDKLEKKWQEDITASKRTQEERRKQIIALKLRLFEGKNFEQIACAIGSPPKRECGRQPFLRGRSNLFEVLGYDHDSFLDTYGSK